MQGSIYTAFSDMVIEQMGMESWNELIDETKPPSQGIYTAGEQYQDSELINMVVLLVEKTGLPIEQLLESFGEFLFDKLYKNSPADLSNIDNLRDFLLAIDSVIHVEVKRLHPQAYLPKFKYIEDRDDQLTLQYFSKRKLCHVSVGLIKGAANKFKQKIQLEHPICMHKGAKYCELVVIFKEG
ncbi:heme NO-binding domain-containing protein [Psychrobium sp. 1_MG-2023]|uniref:heme NO-binding domain-containing protein n=1 Tax=Psychrobium sp. 1_MG-2023 TaxID=3062624 RepID=UPI000C346403|nr:heme NO-binding domain-containing protein [Psychrobium sp. 1_MG-2023]MDP2561649.1 heme NO-binding domain-containing protein [Psychrobium sp. 1_MG-2023]PKF55665.1 guanylate cyclase [Alteromonadales bacterium alter-6D02]